MYIQGIPEYTLHFKNSQVTHLGEIGIVLGFEQYLKDFNMACYLHCLLTTQLLGYQEYSFDYPFDPSTAMAGNIVLLMLVGVFVTGPYSLITTAVSADLGNHPNLQGNEIQYFGRKIE